MNFQKAYTELLEGKKIRRKAWENQTHLRMIEGEVIAFLIEHVSFYDNVNVLISDDWHLSDNDKPLTFIEALEELKLGKVVRREDWPDNKYLLVTNGELSICRPVECAFMPTYKCLCASDWESFK
jgi:hypothetical protein